MVYKGNEVGKASFSINAAKANGQTYVTLHPPNEHNPYFTA
jgi:hypothetical protein